jgi:hypothetical protein
LVINQMATQMIETLNRGEETYLQLFEVWDYAGGTADAFARLLFREEIAARSNPNAEPPVVGAPTAEELAQATDAAEAALVLHEMWQAANNVAVITADRAQKLRRMA